MVTETSFPLASQSRAALDFMNTWQNTLLIGSCVTYWAGRVVLPLLGKSAENHPYLSKMNAQFNSFWAFGDFAKISSSFFVLGSDIATANSGRQLKAIRKGEWNEKEERWIHRPNAEMTLNGNRYTWAAYRSLATLLKMFSAYIAVHAGLKSVGALKAEPSSMMKTCGAAAGLAGLGIDFYDVQSRKKDYAEDNLYKSLCHSDLKDPTKAEFDNAYIKDLSYSQASRVIGICAKVIALLSILSKAEPSGFVGRVMKNPYMGKILENSDDISNGLLIGLIGISGVQQVDVGANKNKWTGKAGTWWAKYAIKSFPESREFIRLVEGTATTLTDFGYDVLAGIDIGSLGKFAKSFDSFLYVPKISERTGGLIDKVGDVIKERSSRNIWKTVFAIVKLFADTFAALKFIGAFEGVVYLSGRVKGLGYLKNGFSSIGAIMAISEEVFFCEIKEGKGDKKPLIQRTLIVLGSTGSLFLNGMGGLASAFSDKIIVPDVNKNFKPGVYNFVKVSSTALAAINIFISAPAE